MGLAELVVLLIIGVIAGWLAGMIMKRGSMGLVGNIVVGVIGVMLGSFIQQSVGTLLVNTGEPFVDAIIVATIFAIILLFVVGLVRR